MTKTFHRNRRQMKPLSPVVDDAKKRVLQALEDPNYKFRTILGISRSAKVTPQQVIQVISEDRGNIVVAARRSTEGETLYASRKRYEQVATLKEKVMGVLFNRVY